MSPPRLPNVTFSLKQNGVPVGFALRGTVLPTLALDFGWRWAATGAGAFGCIFWGALADALRKPSLALAGIGCIVVAAVVTMAMTSPD